jgi:ribosomal protein L13E
MKKRSVKKAVHTTRVSEPLVVRPIERAVPEPWAAHDRLAAGPTIAEMVDAGLDAFAVMTQRLALTRAQEAALLGVSPSTWERYRNRTNVSVLDTRKEFVDRLRLILLIYESSVQFASSHENAAIDLHFAGGAMDPANPALSILDAMMADTSTLDLDHLYQRIDSRIGAV